MKIALVLIDDDDQIVSKRDIVNLEASFLEDSKKYPIETSRNLAQDTVTKLHSSIFEELLSKIKISIDKT